MHECLGKLFISFPTALNHFSCCAVCVNRLTTQILWRAYAKELSRLFSACSQKLHAILTAAIKGWSILRWLQTRLNFLFCPGCLLSRWGVSTHSRELKATTSRSWAGRVSALHSQCLVSSELRFHSRTHAVSFYPSSLLLSGHSVFLRHGSKVKVFPWVKHTHTVSKLYDICLCIHNILYIATEEIKALDDYYYIGFLSEWSLTHWKYLRLSK